MINPKVPSNWEDVTVEQFIELDSIDMEQYETVEAIQLERLSILTNTSSDDDIWDDMDIRKMTNIIQGLKFLSTKPSIKVNQSILDNRLHLIDFNTIKFGEFIDIEFFIREGENQNIHKISSVLFRQTRSGEWGETIYEPYGTIDLEERSKMIMVDAKLTDIYGVINSYKEWRENFLSNYSSLFQGEIDDDYDKESLTEEELQELKEIEEEESVMVEFGWQRMLLSLTENDLTKLDDYLNMNLLTVFNMLSVRKGLKSL